MQNYFVRHILGKLLSQTQIYIKLKFYTCNFTSAHDIATIYLFNVTHNIYSIHVDIKFSKLIYILAKTLQSVD